MFRTQKTLPRRTAGEFQFNCGSLPESYSREQLHIADYIVKYRQSVVSVYRAVRVGIAAALVERVAVGRVLEDSRGVVSVYNSVAVNVAAEIRRRRHLASERDEIASAALDIEYNVSVPVNRRDTTVLFKKNSGGLFVAASKSI